MYAIRGYDAAGRAIMGVYGLNKRQEVYKARAEVQSLPGVVQFRMLFRLGNAWTYRPF